MRISVALLLFAFLAHARADDVTAKVQQSLKDQGFYYGEVNGEKNADTSAAIRRFQIRQGLQVTGELNDETLQALRSSAAASVKPAVTAAPSLDSDATGSHAESSGNAAPPNPAPVQPYVATPRDQPPPPVSPGTSVHSGGLFAATPYETAPPDVQRKVIADAQSILARRGFFRRPIDGFYGPDLEFSLRAYQSRVGLTTTGRLDFETLAALELLPGARARGYGSRPVFPPVPPGPVVRGEWIRP